MFSEAQDSRANVSGIVASAPRREFQGYVCLLCNATR